MTVLLEEINIKNFRSCVDSTFEFAPYTPLVGYNNAGKSNIIGAIYWLLRRSSLGVVDFHNPNSPVVIEGEFSGITQSVLDNLTPENQTKLRNYLHDGEIRIRRTQNEHSAKITDIIFEMWDYTIKSWVKNPTGIDNAISAIFPDPIRIEAMENAADDVSKSRTTTTIGKLLAKFIKPIKEAHEDELNTHLNDVSKKISADGEHRVPELINIDESINSKIADLFPGISLKLDFAVPTLDELIRNGTVKVYEGVNQGRPFTSYGHGAQRSIQMALVRYLSEIQKVNTANQTTLLLIDEPELYLHPFAIEQIRDALESLSKSGYQVIFSTHSGQMITSEQAQYTLLIRKDDGGTRARKRLLKAIQETVPNSVHQMEHLFSLSNANQILFAERVILTEGKTEQRLLPDIFHHACNKTLGQCNIAFVTQGGVDNTKRSRDILNAMDIPSKAIVDLDYIFRGAIEGGYISKTDQDIIELKGKISILANTHGFKCCDKGLPAKKGGSISSAEAYELMAKDADAKPHILEIHKKLKEKGIWVWIDGAIEVPLGLSDKTENRWAEFMKDLKEKGLDQTCPNGFKQIRELFEWIQL